jgi:hypothetical protein
LEKLISRDHYHPRPPNGKPHPIHLKQLANAVQNNPSALPHQLRVGTAIPYVQNISQLDQNLPSQSVANIAPQFNNLGTVGYYRKKIMANTPGLIASTAGSDNFILDYLKFSQECVDFIQNFQLDNNVAIISVQSPFVRTLFTAVSHFSGTSFTDSMF